MIAVIGAGAAGLMAAIHAARAGVAVELFERTEDGGRKILISGGGRCNILPAQLDPTRFVTDSSAHSLRNILKTWPLDAQRRFFEDELGIALVREDHTGKLFPAKGRARGVRDKLLAEAKRAGAVFRPEWSLTELDPVAGGWRLGFDGQPPVTAEQVILASGGLSVPQSGSDGTGLELVRRLGIPVNPTYPALTPLLDDSELFRPLAGVSLTVEITAMIAEQTRQVTGGFLFTHHGYSGPSVMDVSDLVTRARLGIAAAPQLLVRWTPKIDREAWDKRLQQQSTRRVATVIREEMPDRLAEQLVKAAGLPLDVAQAQLTRDARLELLGRLTRFRLTWTGDGGYLKAEVTGGGVSLAAVDPATMECREHPGLFLCGEILDAFGPIGGYNFVWAWATGRLAGRGAAEAARAQQPA